MISVIIPAYNEEKRLEATLLSMIKSLKRRFAAFEIIVVDDGSNDHTSSLVKTMAGKYPEIQLVGYEENRGKGYAVRKGVLASRGEYVLYTDADQSTPIREVRKLISALDHEGVDVAIGSRAVRTSRILQYQPVYRVLMGKVFNKFVQLLAVPGIKDTQCGFKCIRGPLAREIFSCCRIDGFGFDVEVLFLAKLRGMKIVEIGVLWKNDPESKVHPVRHSLQMLLDLFRIRFHASRGDYGPRS